MSSEFPRTDPSQRPRMTPEMGVAYDENCQPFDVTLWRKDMLAGQPSPENPAEVIIQGPDGTQWQIDPEGHGEVSLPGEVVAETTEELLGDASYQSDIIDTLDYAILVLFTYSDVASATDGLVMAWSIDGTNWDGDDVYTVPAGAGKTFSFQTAARYVRLTYINGTSPQGAFRLQLVAKHGNVKPSSHRVSDPIIDDDDAELVTSVVKAKFDGDGYGNITATASGNLKVANVEDGLAIAKGQVIGTSFIHKFGAAPDFDTADGFVTVWDGAEDGEPYELMHYVYSTTADIDSISSENTGDTQEVEVQGLDEDYNLIVQTATLAGQARVALATPLIRVFRAKNNNSVDFTGHVFVYVNGTLSGGVPVVNADIRAVIHPENNQTEMAVFTIPAGKIGYMRSWYASTAGAKRDSAHTIKLLARPFGKVFQLKHKANIDVNGTSYIHHEYVEP